MSAEKDERRKRLSSFSFTEKIRILEELRDRSLILAASGLRRNNSAKQTQVPKNLSAEPKREG